MRAALVRNGIVENIIMAEEGYTPPEGFTVVSIEDAAELPRLAVEPPVDPREAIEAEYQAAISTGHCVTPEGYCIACDEPDVNRWANYLTELREREALLEGDPFRVTADSDIPFFDISGTARAAKLPRARQIFLEAGFAWKTAFFTRSSALTALQG